jgi:hypothetical protein
VEEIIKCKSIIHKHGKDRVCDRYLGKRIDEEVISLKCKCGCTALVFIDNKGKLKVEYVNKEKELLCQKA